jgi:hypothetical protein
LLPIQAQQDWLLRKSQRSTTLSVLNVIVETRANTLTTTARLQELLQGFAPGC